MVNYDPADGPIVMLPPVIEVRRVEISPVEERPLTQGMEFRRTDNPATCFVQVGPMRYEVDAEALVSAVLSAFPMPAHAVVNAHLGIFEFSATREVLGAAVQRSFNALVQYARGVIPTRIRGPIELVAEVVNEHPLTVAEMPKVMGCDFVVDESISAIVIDYGNTGYPFSMTVNVVAAPPA